MKIYNKKKFQSLKFFIFFYTLFIFILGCSSGEKKENNKSITSQIANEFDGDNTNNYHIIYIKKLENNTSEIDLNNRLYEKLISAFQSDGRLKVDEKKENADLILSGKFIRFLKRPIGFDTFGQANKFSFHLIISIKLRINTKESNETIFDNRLIQYVTQFDNTQSAFEDEYTAEERLLDGIKDRVILTVFTGWYSDLKTLKELGYDPDREKRKELYNSIRKDLPIEEIKRLQEKYKELNKEDIK